MALKIMKEFLDGFTPDHVYCVITHCDLYEPDQEQMMAKLESFEKYGGVKCHPHNVFTFNQTVESLVPFVCSISDDNPMFIRHDL